MNKENKTKINLSFGSWLGLIFFLCLFLTMFFREFVFGLLAPAAIEISEGKKASKEVAAAILLLDKITLDTTILQSEYFQNIKILPTFPTDSKTLSNFGKANPFLGNFQIVPPGLADTLLHFAGAPSAGKSIFVRPGNFKITDAQHGLQAEVRSVRFMAGYYEIELEVDAMILQIHSMSRQIKTGATIYIALDTTTIQFLQ